MGIPPFGGIPPHGMTGDSGSGGKAGYVPAPSAGDAAAGKYLKADGTWATAGGGSSPVSQANYLFATSTTMADPSAGNVRYNSATVSSVTALAISVTGTSSQANYDALKRLQANDTLEFVNGTSSTKWARFTITAITDNTTWFQFTVKYVSVGGGGLPSASDSLTLLLTHAFNDSTAWRSKSGAPTTTDTGNTSDFYYDTNTAGRYGGTQVYGPKPASAISATTTKREQANGWATLTFASHSFTVGMQITVSGVGGSGYNISTFITATTATTITYKISSGTEASTADTGGTVVQTWGTTGLMNRSIPAFAYQAYGNVSPSLPGWFTISWGEPGVGTALSYPWTIYDNGVASYIVGAASSTISGANATSTNESYATWSEATLRKGSNTWIATSFTAPSEAGGEVGFGWGADGGGGTATLITLQNDNKLRIRTGSVPVNTSMTTQKTSTGTATTGTVYIRKTGPLVEVFAPAWSYTDNYVGGLAYGFSANLLVYVRGTNTGKLSLANLNFGST